jgi:hypothetical protein
MAKKLILAMIWAFGILAIYNACEKESHTPGKPLSTIYDGVWSMSFSYFPSDIDSCGSSSHSGNNNIHISKGRFSSSGPESNIRENCGTITTMFSVIGSIDSSGNFWGTIDGQSFNGYADSLNSIKGSGPDDLTITLSR